MSDDIKEARACYREMGLCVIEGKVDTVYAPEGWVPPTDYRFHADPRDTELHELWASLSEPEKTRATRFYNGFVSVQGVGGPATRRNDWFDAIAETIAEREA